MNTVVSEPSGPVNSHIHPEGATSGVFMKSAGSNEVNFEPEDSEAETERLHDSPEKKRLQDEIKYDASSKELFDHEPKSNSLSSIPESSETQVAVVESPPAKKVIDADRSSEDAANNSGEEIEPVEGVGIEEADADDADDAEAEEEDDDVVNSDEQRRLAAINELSEIEIDYANIRNSLHDQQMQKYDLEITMCEKGIHPELEMYEKQLKEDQMLQLQRNTNLLTFEINSILTESHASRCFAHRTFIKSKLALRRELSSTISNKWRHINKERSKIIRENIEFGYFANSQPYKIRKPTIDSLGIEKNPGLFNLPSAPDIPQASEAECEEDFRNIGLL